MKTFLCMYYKVPMFLPMSVIIRSSVFLDTIMNLRVFNKISLQNKKQCFTMMYIF